MYGVVWWLLVANHAYLQGSQENIITGNIDLDLLLPVYICQLLVYCSPKDHSEDYLNKYSKDHPRST